MKIDTEIKNRIKSLLTEAKIYMAQGLLEEAMAHYRNVERLIVNSKNLKNRESLAKGINKKISDLEEEILKVEEMEQSPAMSSQVQDLIRTKFAFSRDKNQSALEGAIALAKFGQYQRAMEEFHRLLEVKDVRLIAAKNIIRCHVAVSAVDTVVDLYQNWLRGELFTQEQLFKLNMFLKSILDSKGIDITLPTVEEPADFALSGLVEPDADDDEFMDISSIGISLDNGSGKETTIDLDVSFQSGNEINLLISSKNRELIDNLKVGFRLNEVQFYSPFAIFTGSGVVSAKTQIKSGPKQGDYSLDIKVVST